MLSYNYSTGETSGFVGIFVAHKAAVVTGDDKYPVCPGDPDFTPNSGAKLFLTSAAFAIGVVASFFI
jgi:hypothetical protein